MKLTEEKAIEIDKGINRNQWFNLQNLKNCFMCKAKIPLYKEGNKGEKILNGKYLAHLYTSHGLPPENVIDMIADKIYNNKEDKNKMREFYKYIKA